MGITIPVSITHVGYPYPRYSLAIVTALLRIGVLYPLPHILAESPGIPRNPAESQGIHWSILFFVSLPNWLKDFCEVP
jgi:hypothetical protein